MPPHLGHPRAVGWHASFGIQRNDRRSKLHAGLARLGFIGIVTNYGLTIAERLHLRWRPQRR